MVRRCPPKVHSWTKFWAIKGQLCSGARGIRTRLKKLHPEPARARIGMRGLACERGDSEYSARNLIHIMQITMHRACPADESWLEWHRRTLW